MAIIINFLVLLKNTLNVLRILSRKIFTRFFINFGDLFIGIALLLSEFQPIKYSHLKIVMPLLLTEISLN